MTPGFSDRMPDAALGGEPGTDLPSSVSLASRTALTSIIGYAEMLITADDGRVPERLRMLQAIEQNGHRLLALLARGMIFPLPHLDVTDRTHGTDHSVDISALLERVRAELSSTLVSFEPRVTVLVSPGLRVDSDTVTGLRLVAHHLVENAIKYSRPRSPVEVHAARAGDLLSLRISDAGMGIPPEEHQKVFERFYRSARALDLQIPGDGLGLTTARNIVLRNGGSIDLDSVPTVGTTVTVTLPVGTRGRLNADPEHADDRADEPAAASERRRSQSSA